MPGDGSCRQPEFACHGIRNGRALVAKPSQSADRTAQRYDQRAAPQPRQLSCRLTDTREPDSNLEPKGNRRRVLTIGATGADGVPVLGGQTGEPVKNSDQIGSDEVESIP